MRFQICCILLALAAVAYASEKKDDPRSFIGTGLSFATFTLIKATTTTTSTFTSTITCTTSTAALSVCSAGRRRRGLFYDDGEAQGRNRRGLFYNDDEVEKKDGSVFIASSDPKDEVLPVKTEAKEEILPLELQPGFSLPEGLSPNRFLLAFGTSTVTSVTITTSTSSITATCSSVTNFPTCANTGK